MSGTSSQVNRSSASTVTPDQLIEIMSNYEYPISAVWMAKQLGDGVTRKDVNAVLYKMKKEGTVEQLEMSPPLWRVTE